MPLLPSQIVLTTLTRSHLQLQQVERKDRRRLRAHRLHCSALQSSAPSASRTNCRRPPQPEQTERRTAVVSCTGVGRLGLKVENGNGGETVRPRCFVLCPTSIRLTRPGPLGAGPWALADRRPREVTRSGAGGQHPCGSQRRAAPASDFRGGEWLCIEKKGDTSDRLVGRRKPEPISSRPLLLNS